MEPIEPSGIRLPSAKVQGVTPFTLTVGKDYEIVLTLEYPDRKRDSQVWNFRTKPAKVGKLRQLYH